MAAAVAAAALAAAAALEVEATAAAPLPLSRELPWPELVATALPPRESRALQIVSLPAARCPAPDTAVVVPRARPLVTLWKFNRTSPSEDEMRAGDCGAAV